MTASGKGRDFPAGKDIADQPGAGAEIRPPVRLFRVTAEWSASLSSMLADWDLLLLLILIMADIRVFRGSSVASFTLYELFAWAYCAPVVLGHCLRRGRIMAAEPAHFVWFLSLYLGWILLASISALTARHSSEVLQQTKNIAPALPLACFVLMRVRRSHTVARLANLYVIGCFIACLLAVVQLKHGGPYLRAPIENNEFKLEYGGEVVHELALGFSSTPNELAVVVLPGVMFSAIKLASELREKTVPRIVTLISCVATGVPFILAQSRGAVVWFLFGFAFMTSPLRNTRLFSIKLILVASVITVLVLYGLHSGPSSSPMAENTVEVRYLLWKTSLDAMSTDPYVAVLGDGLPYVQHWSWLATGWEFPDAHNGWLDQALFFGVPALLLYLAIWWCFFSTTDAVAASRRLCPRSVVLLDSIRAIVLSFMGLYFFEPVAHAVFPVSQLFLLMTCGLALAESRSREDLPQSESPSRRPSIARSPPPQATSARRTAKAEEGLGS